MKAIGYPHQNTSDSLLSFMEQELPTPTLKPRDLLVRVQAISVNPVDYKIRERVNPEEGDFKVLGWDAVGTVEAIGDAVEHYQVGDQVFYAGDLTRQGTNAELHAVDERIVGRKPSSLSAAQAAALPLTAITAWEMLFDRLGVQSAKDSAPTVLIIGAAGGVGSIAIQLLKQLTYARVIATASRPESESWVRSLGADAVINHREAFAPQLEAQGLEAPNVVLGLNDTERYFEQIAEIIAPQGKLALIDDPEGPLNMNLLKLKSVSFHWEFMYTRSMFETHDMGQQRALLNRVSELVDEGKLKTSLGQNLGNISVENIAKAHEILRSGTSIGKLVMEGF